MTLQEIKQILADLDRVITDLWYDKIHNDVFSDSLVILFLACLVGYYLVWRIPHSMHAPLMALTNAISSVIVVAAIQGFKSSDPFIWFLSGLGVMLASINIFGGFRITQRMLQIFNEED